MNIQNVGKVINMEKETIVEVTKLGFTIQAAVKVIGKDLLITLTGGDTPHIGTVTTFSRDTEIQTVRFPLRWSFPQRRCLSRKNSCGHQNAVPGSCTITSGIHVDHISNAQINASFPMSEELGYKILDWLEKQISISKEPVYYKDGENHYERRGCDTSFVITSCFYSLLHCNCYDITNIFSDVSTNIFS